MQDSQVLGKAYGLVGFRLVSAEVKAEVFSNGDAEMKATISDMALLDLLEDRQGRNTG